MKQKTQPHTNFAASQEARQHPMKEQYQQIVKDLHKVKEETQKGVITISRADIWFYLDLLLDGEPWYKLPVFANNSGVELSANDCVALLDFVVLSSSNPYSKEEKPLSLMLKEGGTDPEKILVWLDLLGIWDHNGTLCNWFFENGFAHKRMLYVEKYAIQYSGYEKEISLTRKGIDFIWAAKKLYVNYGHQLVRNKFPELTYATHAVN